MLNFGLRGKVARPFTILSLAGGGARGIFQAAFLLRVERELQTELHKHVALVAGTSTGAIVALAVGLRVPLERVVDLYRSKAAEIFRQRRFSWITRGPRYDQGHLKQALIDVFGNQQLRDVKPYIVVPATALDRFEHRIFSNIDGLSGTDRVLSAVEIALSTSAAPTYFSPVKPASEERSYADGGVWANSPSLVAVLVAHHHLGIEFSTMRLASIGTGTHPQGIIPDQMARMRPMSLTSVRTVLELIWGSTTVVRGRVCRGFSRSAPQPDGGRAAR